MKVFDLTCGSGHRFEGWFASAEQFAAQCDTQAVRCPLCDSAEIRREPSAPRLNFANAAPQPHAVSSASAASSAHSARALIERLRHLVANTEDVGARFAEEARRIHYDEVPERPIRGTATAREKQDLLDEGIETIALPIPRALLEPMQ